MGDLVAVRPYAHLSVKEQQEIRERQARGSFQKPGAIFKIQAPSTYPGPTDGGVTGRAFYRTAVFDTRSYLYSSLSGQDQASAYQIERDVVMTAGQVQLFFSISGITTAVRNTLLDRGPARFFVQEFGDPVDAVKAQEQPINNRREVTAQVYNIDTVYQDTVVIRVTPTGNLRFWACAIVLDTYTADPGTYDVPLRINVGVY